MDAAGCCRGNGYTSLKYMIALWCCRTQLEGQGSADGMLRAALLRRLVE